MDLIKALNEKQLKEVPQVQVGDTVRVHVKVKEGYILPPSRPSRPCVTFLCAAPSCTICVTVSARPPRSARSCKRIRSKKSRLLMRAVFSFSFHENCGIIG